MLGSGQPWSTFRLAVLRIVVVSELALQITGAEPLHEAAKRGRTSEIEQLLKENADIELRDADGGTALLYAAWHGSPETIRLLLAHGASVKVQDTYGYTPLHWARTRDLAHLYIQRGANVNARLKDGQTPLLLPSIS